MSAHTFRPVPLDRDYVHTIDGQPASFPSTLPVLNPATKQPIAHVPAATRMQLNDTVSAAARAFPAWRETPLHARQAAVAQLADLLGQFKDEFAALLVREQGRPLAQCVGEVDGAIAWARAIAALSVAEPPVVEQPGREFVTTYAPLGVCAGIVPWNYPLMMAVWKIAPALVTGNCLILKPSPFTPLCGLKLVELAQQVLPPGVLSALSGDDALGPWITAHPGIAKVSFTGSTATGKRIIASAADSVKRLTLEMGGNDAAIVCEDVDVEEIAPQLFMALFMNTGQICAATKRLYVHDSVYDALGAALVRVIQSKKIGAGTEPGVDIGPLQNKMQYDKVVGFIDDCKQNGYTFLCGGTVDASAPGYFLPLTLVSDPPEHSRIVREEPFGPIAPLLRWSDEEDVIARANAGEHGLGAAVWCRDAARADRIAGRMEAGTVWVNSVQMLDPRAPFGGWKASGLGVENGEEGLRAWCNTRTFIRAKA